MAGGCASAAARTRKIYFNWKSGKSEKCIFCYPRIEAGMPTVCAETCVGRIRYLGVLLYDADRISEVASTANEQDLYEKQLEIFLDPNDPAVIRQALADGVPQSVIDSAQRSPVYKNGRRLETGTAAAPGIPHLADGLVRTAAVADPERRHCRHRRYERSDSGRRQPAYSTEVPGQPADRRR